MCKIRGSRLHRLTFEASISWTERRIGNHRLSGRMPWWYRARRPATSTVMELLRQKDRDTLFEFDKVQTWIIDRTMAAIVWNGFGRPVDDYGDRMCPICMTSPCECRYTGDASECKVCGLTYCSHKYPHDEWRKTADGWVVLHSNCDVTCRITQEHPVRDIIVTPDRIANSDEIRKRAGLPYGDAPYWLKDVHSYKPNFEVHPYTQDQLDVIEGKGSDDLPPDEQLMALLDDDTLTDEEVAARILLTAMWLSEDDDDGDSLAR